MPDDDDMIELIVDPAMSAHLWAQRLALEAKHNKSADDAEVLSILVEMLDSAQPLGPVN